MKVGIFYQMWQGNQKAAYESLKQIRKVYPDNEIAILVVGVKREDLDLYENSYLSIIRRDFNIKKIEHLHKDDNIGYFDQGRTVDDLLEYNDILLEKTLYMFEESTEYVINASEDLYIFKEIPINPNFDVCGNPRPWDYWMKEEMKEKFNYDKFSDFIWFQHGHYLNLKKLKEVFNQQKRDYVIKTLKDLYPNELSIFSDFFIGVWCALAYDTFSRADYLLELPSEITEETPLETFNRTDCYARHGYKALYNQPL